MVSCKPKDGVEISEKMGWNSSKPGESQPKTASLSTCAERSGASAGTADAKEIREDLLQGYQKAREKGYKRSYGCFKRTARQEVPEKTKKHVRKNKPYERAEYPGRKVQVDVKYVPCHCVVDGRAYYVYCAKDEYSRWTYREMFDGHSTKSSETFLRHLVEHAPFPIFEIQTDNGTEFTKHLLTKDKTDLMLFETLMAEYGICYHRIRPATPRHNGKVERGNRTDELRFYSKLKMFSLADGRKQLAVYQRKSNDIIMTCLGMRSPNQIVRLYQAVMR